MFFLIAEFITRLELVPQLYLPHASTVVRRMAELLQDPKFLKGVLATLEAWSVGLALSILITVPLGIWIGTSKLASTMTAPLIELMRPIPSVALIPIGILLWGQGFAMKVILVTYATSWPILFNTIYGVHDVDPIAVQTARCFGLNRLAILLPHQPSQRSSIHLHGCSHLGLNRPDRRGWCRAAGLGGQRHRLIHSFRIPQRRPDGFGAGRSGHRGDRRRDHQRLVQRDRSPGVRVAIPWCEGRMSGAKAGYDMQ